MTKPEIDDRLTFFTHLMNFTCFMNFFLASCTLLPALFTCFMHFASFVVTASCTLLPALFTFFTYFTFFFITAAVAEVLIIAKNHVDFSNEQVTSETTQESVSNLDN